MKKILTIAVLTAGLAFASAGQAEASGITIKIGDDHHKSRKHAASYDYGHHGYYGYGYPIFYKAYPKRFYKKQYKKSRHSSKRDYGKRYYSSRR